VTERHDLRKGGFSHFAFRLTTVYFNNYLQHCISHTAVHTNDTDFTEQVGVVKKKFRVKRIKYVGFG